jgi:hypothetical protein
MEEVDILNGHLVYIFLVIWYILGHLVYFWYVVP